MNKSFDNGAFTVYSHPDRPSQVEMYVNDEHAFGVEDLLPLVVFLARQGIIRGWVGRMISMFLK